MISFITGTEASEREDEKIGSSKGKRKRAQAAATRDAKSIPNLIYAIEQYVYAPCHAVLCRAVPVQNNWQCFRM